MVSVEQLIGELLLRHNCVIIPSFGGFVAKQAPAVIDFKSGVMTPPRKSLLFNRQLINNDGLLIAEFAVANSIQYNQATDTVQQLVGKWNDQLRKGFRITIDKVGFLYFDSEKNICFEQDRFFNLLLESYGLGKVHFLTESDVQLAQKTTIERAISGNDSNEKQPAILFDTEKIVAETVGAAETKVIEHSATRSKTKAWRYVAAACLLPIAFYSFWLPMRTNVLESGMLSIKDFNPFYKSQEGTYEKEELDKLEKREAYTSLEESVANLPSDVTVYSYQYDEDLYIPVRLPATSNGSAQELETVQLRNADQSTLACQFIVGCFGSEENANNLVSALKTEGIDAYVYDESNGLKRISAGGSATEAGLQTLISNVEAKGFDGWVLKK
jgi:hypothetical protein